MCDKIPTIHRKDYRESQVDSNQNLAHTIRGDNDVIFEQSISSS